MLRDILKEGKDKKETKMLGKLHSLDDTIEDFIGGLEDELNNIEDNPVFVKKAHQLLANMSKEYAEFILALRAVVNAIDRKGQLLPNQPMEPMEPKDANLDNRPPEEEEEKEDVVSVGSAPPAPNESKVHKFLTGGKI